MLRAAGFPRETVFIANVLKCRPPGNRDPKPEEVACCMPYLARQIELVNPRMILCVGRIAAQNLLNTDTPIGKLRGQVHRLGAQQRPVVVTYHPAYLLRSPGEKRKAWDDLQLALRTYAAEPARPM
jgi:DNA polymerase